MPRVPVLQERVQLGSIPSVQAGAPLPARDDQLTQAGTRFSRTIQQIGLDEKAKADKAMLTKASAQAFEIKNEIEAKAFAKQGENSFDIMETDLPELQKRLDEIKGGLKNREQISAFNNMQMRILAGSQEGFYRHIGGQRRAFQQEQNKYWLDNKRNDAILNKYQPGYLDESIAEAVTKINDDERELFGSSDEEIKAKVQQEISDYNRGAIISAINEKNRGWAKERFNKAMQSKALTPQAADDIRGMLERVDKDDRGLQIALNLYAKHSGNMADIYAERDRKYSGDKDIYDVITSIVNRKDQETENALIQQRENDILTASKMLKDELSGQRNNHNFVGPVEHAVDVLPLELRMRLDSYGPKAKKEIQSRVSPPIETDPSVYSEVVDVMVNNPDWYIKNGPGRWAYGLSQDRLLALENKRVSMNNRAQALELKLAEAKVDKKLVDDAAKTLGLNPKAKKTSDIKKYRDFDGRIHLAIIAEQERVGKPLGYEERRAIVNRFTDEEIFTSLPEIGGIFKFSPFGVPLIAWDISKEGRIKWPWTKKKLRLGEITSSRQLPGDIRNQLIMELANEKPPKPPTEKNILDAFFKWVATQP